MTLSNKKYRQKLKKSHVYCIQSLLLCGFPWRCVAIMDVSNTFWDLVHMLNHMSCKDIRASQLFQRYEFASYLNRRFILDEAALVDSNCVTVYPKGTSYNHFHAFYEFTNLRSLFFGAMDILRSSNDFAHNKDTQDKCYRLVGATRALEEFEILGDLTAHLSKLKC